MPLDKQNISFPFVGGIDTKTDEKHVKPTQLTLLENGVFDKTGTINKRHGYAVAPSLDTNEGDALLVGGSVYEYENELIVNAERVDSGGDIGGDDGWVMASYDSVADEWVTIGRKEPISLAVDKITPYGDGPGGLKDNADMAVTNGYACYAWINTGSTHALGRTHVSVVELATGALIIDEEDIWGAGGANNQNGVKVIAIGDIFWIWSTSAANLVLLKAHIDTNTLPNITVQVIEEVDVHADGLWDACLTDYTGAGADTCSVVAYKQNVTNDINLEWYDSTGANVHTATIARVAIGALCIFEAQDGATTRLVVCWQDSVANHIYARVANQDGTWYTGAIAISIATATETIWNITGCLDPSVANEIAGNHFRVYVEIVTIPFATTQYHYVRHITSRFDLVVATDMEINYNCVLASKAFNHGGKARVWTCYAPYPMQRDAGPPVIYEEPLQPTFFLRTPTDYVYKESTTDAKILYGSAGGYTGFRSCLPQVVSLGSNEWIFAQLQRHEYLTLSTDTCLKSIVGIRTQFSVTAQASNQMGPTKQFAGGFIGDADGRFCDIGFHLYPEKMQAVSSGGGSTGVPATWTYTATYEYKDRKGQLHRSAPAIPVEITTINNDDHVLLRIPCLHQGDWDKLYDKVWIKIYRTENLGAVFHWITNIDANARSAYLDIYDGGVGPHVPAISDGDLAQQEILYTDGGVIENIGPPASQIIIKRRDRLFIVPDDDPENVWFSKDKADGIGVEFSDLLTKRVSTGGKTYAGGTIDDKIILFKASEIRAFSGDGPNALGIGTFTPDYLVTTSMGCSNNNSIATTDKGLMFEATGGGIYLLNRGMQVEYIGAPVDDYRQYSVVKAVLVEQENQVRFLMSNEECLVYDYLVNQWSVFTNHDGIDACVYNDAYTYMRASAVINRQDTSFTDKNGIILVPYSLVVETAWIKLQGIQGYQRISWNEVIGNYKSACQLGINTYINYINTSVQTKAVNLTGTFDDVFQCRWKPESGKAKCEAVKYRFSDGLLLTGTREGYSISGLDLIIGVKKGLHKLSQAQTIG